MREPKRHARFFAAIVAVVLVVVTTIAKAADTIPRGRTSTETVARKVTPWLETEFLASMGYRVDDLDWNIAGNINGNNPNILSELTWSNLEICQIKLSNKTRVLDIFYLRGSLSRGWIFDGDNQDSDYAGDDRTLEYSRSNNSADDGNVWDASLGVGFELTFGSERFGIAPLIGYSYHKQNLTITDGFQTIYEPAPQETGPFAGLNSTYQTEWKGPWIGMDLNFHIDMVEFCLGIEHHWADYTAEANWNLARRFAHPKSFEHRADGNGVVISAACNIYFNERWATSLSYDYQDWSTDPGIDRVYWSQEYQDLHGYPPTSDTRLNEVNWTSHAIMLGIVYRF